MTKERMAPATKSLRALYVAIVFGACVAAGLAQAQNSPCTHQVDLNIQTEVPLGEDNRLNPVICASSAQATLPRYAFAVRYASDVSSPSGSVRSTFSARRINSNGELQAALNDVAIAFASGAEGAITAQFLPTTGFMCVPNGIGLNNTATDLKLEINLADVGVQPEQILSLIVVLYDGFASPAGASIQVQPDAYFEPALLVGLFTFALIPNDQDSVDAIEDAQEEGNIRVPYFANSFLVPSDIIPTPEPTEEPTEAPSQVAVEELEQPMQASLRSGVGFTGGLSSAINDFARQAFPEDPFRYRILLPQTCDDYMNERPDETMNYTLETVGMPQRFDERGDIGLTEAVHFAIYPPAVAQGEQPGATAFKSVSIRASESIPTPSPDPVCFPAHATVELASGERIRMDQVQVGDLVRVSPSEFSPVVLWGHREKHAVFGEFVALHVSESYEGIFSSRLVLAHSHLLYVNGELRPAGSVRIGDVTLNATTGTAMRVVRVEHHVRAAGLFHPHTAHGDVAVDGIIVSCYSHMLLPAMLQHALLLIQRVVHRAFLDLIGHRGASVLGSLLESGAPSWARPLLT
ncbi:Desert hedgehog protein [Porphyridium purpureum]|uniref:Desert hedgehog protein n=1 Tax=Porphyridium purpureum TaxID=35688 RepID=A0A5J4YLM4_PORPP|nr:Desert hedgehog protein [Porphyridium purpureum]|eukprot:POR7187..scf295_9